MESTTPGSAARKRRALGQEPPSTPSLAPRKRKKYDAPMRLEAVDRRRLGACPSCKKKNKTCGHRVRKTASKENLRAPSPRFHYTRGRVSASDSQAGPPGFPTVISTWEALEFYNATTGESSMHLNTSKAISAYHEIPVAHVEDLEAIFEPRHMDIVSEPTGQSLQTAGRAADPTPQTLRRTTIDIDDSHTIDSPTCNLLDKSSLSQFIETQRCVTSSEIHLKQLSEDDMITDEVHGHIKKERTEHGLVFTGKQEISRPQFASQVPRSRSSSPYMNSDTSNTRTHSSQSINTAITTPFEDTCPSSGSMLDRPQRFNKQLPPTYLSAPLNGPLASLLNDCLKIRDGLRTHRRPAPRPSSPSYVTDIYRAESESYTQSIDAWQSKCASWAIDALVHERSESENWEEWL